MRRLPALAGAAVMLLAVAGPAAGAPPWSLPTTPSERADALYGLEFGADGRAALAFDDERPQQAMGDASAGFKTVAGFPREGSIAVHPFGRDRLLVLRTRGGRDLATDPIDLGVSFGDSSGRLGKRQRIAGFRPPRTDSFPSMSVGSGGHAAVVWLERGRRDERPHLRLAQRRPGFRFGAPSTVTAVPLPASSEVVHPVVAVGPRGRMAIVWVDGRAVKARVGSVGGRLGRIQVLGRQPGAGIGSFPSAAIAARVVRRRIVVAWGPPRRLGESGGRGWTVRVAIAPARSGRFRRAQRLGSPGRVSDVGGGLALALSPAGDAVLAWSDYARFPALPHVHVALAMPNGRFAALADLGEGLVADASMRRDGAALVTWTQGIGPVLAAVRLPDTATFQAPELVSAADESAFGARSAFDPVGGGALVAWIANVPIADPGTATLHAAGRPAP